MKHWVLHNLWSLTGSVRNQTDTSFVICEVQVLSNQGKTTASWKASLEQQTATNWKILPGMSNEPITKKHWVVCYRKLSNGSELFSVDALG